MTALTTTKDSLSATQKAAIILMTLGEEAAAEILRHLSPKEVQKIGSAMASLPAVNRQTLETIFQEFELQIQEQTTIGVGNDEYVRTVLTQALGADKASGLIDRILLGRNTKGLDNLKWMDPRSIADLIKQEHPQIQAIVLAHLESDQAAETLRFLPERNRGDIVLRIARLDGVPPHALNELNDIMERQIAGAQTVRSAQIGGVKVAATLLTQLDTSTEQQVLASIAGTDADLGRQIRELMFVFDDLVNMDDRSIQVLLREVANDVLGLALRGADLKVKDKILRNMSQRASQILQEDMEAKGPVKLSEVESAQKEILSTVRRLTDEGQIVAVGKGETVI